ncbi:MAG TPA: peptidoglycan-binding protein [Chloroflexota bacterium]|nr:peptidoglycan-binding protein [Chloroflexota bacterium]
MTSTANTAGSPNGAATPASSSAPPGSIGGLPGGAGGAGNAAMSLAAASIINIDSGGAPIRCHFNPKEYTFSKSNTWKTGDTKGANVPPIEFEKGQPATLQLQLLFDTYTERADVRQKYTDALWRLMLVDESLKDQKTKKSRPPKVRFQWGQTWSFEGVIEKLTQKFTLFLPDGTPVRATVDVGFRQIKDDSLYPRQNPTSGGLETVRLWTVQDGDTLAWIAHKEYGDPQEWRRIADANRMTQVRRLRPGTVLEVPGV